MRNSTGRCVRGQLPEGGELASLYKESRNNNTVEVSKQPSLRKWTNRPHAPKKGHRPDIVGTLDEDRLRSARDTPSEDALKPVSRR